MARMTRCSAAPVLIVMVRIFGRAGALVTVRVNAWVAVPFLFLAVRVSRYTPAAVFAGVPEIVAVPPPLSANLTPGGSCPVSVILGAGSPAVVTVNVNAAPKAAVAAERLEKVGPWLTAAGVIAMASEKIPVGIGIGGPAVLVAVAIGVTVPGLP